MSEQPHSSEAPDRAAPSGDRSVELASRRTGMSFQRTRMSADRTLMSVIRTSLSLISFGFTIRQFFERLQDEDVVTRAEAPRNFGMALVYLGVAMVAVGILFHLRFMAGLRHQRESMAREGLVHAESEFPVSYTLLIAVLLLLIGVSTITSAVFNLGPFR